MCDVSHVLSQILLRGSNVPNVVIGFKIFATPFEWLEIEFARVFAIIRFFINMAKRKSFNRLSRRYSKHKTIDSFGSGHLDPDTAIVDEEQTFWWNNLGENTFPPHSMIHSENETPRQLNVDSRIDFSQDSVSTGWWKILESDNSEPIASTSSRRSASIAKHNIVQTSSSESEKEPVLRKKKVRLKAIRKSINNAFADALNDTEATIPLKLRMKRIYSNVHSDLDSGSLQERSQKRLQENNEDSNSSPTEKILKSKPSIFKRRRGEGKEDQNAFQDILTEDDVLNGSTVGKSVAFEKESSKRSMHRNLNASKDHIDNRKKSISAPQTMPLENIESGSSTPNVEKAVLGNNAEIDQSSDDESIVLPRQHLKLKSHFMQRTRKSIGKNAFADALADDSNANLSTSNPNKENSIHRSSISRSSLSPSKRSVNLKTSKDNIDIMPESSSIRKSPRSSLNIAKKQQSVQAKDDTEASLSSSSSDNNKSRGTKRSVFLKPKSRILKDFRKRSTNLFEDIFKQGNISGRRSNVSTEDNRASFERGTITRINQDHKSSAIQKNPQSEKNRTTNKEDSYEISLEVSSNVEKSGSKESNILSEDENKLLENSDLKNASKSISQKDVIAKSSEEKISSRKSIRGKTLKEPAHPNAISPVGRLSINETVIQDVSDDSYTDIDVRHDLSMSELSSDKKTRFTRNNLRNQSETPVNIEVHEVNDHLHNASREHDSSTLKRLSKLTPSKEVCLTRNSLRTRSETPVNKEVHEVNDHLHNASREHDSSTLKRLSKLTPSKKARLTRNNLRTLSETPKPANIQVHENINNSRNDVNKEHDSSTLKRLSKLTPSKEARLTRNSLRNRSETPKPANIEIHESINNSRNDANREHDSNMLKQLSKSSPNKEGRLTRNSSRNQSETLKSMSKNLEVSKRSNMILDSDEDSNVNVDSETSTDDTVHIITKADIHSKDSTNIGTQKSTILSTEMETIDEEDAEPARQTIQRNSSSTKFGISNKVIVNQSETLKSTSKNMEVSKPSMNLIADIEEDNDVNVDSETSTISILHVITKADVHSKDNTNIGTQKSTILSTEMEVIDDEDAEPARQTIQRNSLTNPRTSKTVNRQSVQSSNRASIKDNREIANRQKSLSKSQNYRNTPTKSSSKDISSNKQSSSKTLRKIDDFFKIKETSMKQLNERAQKLQVFNSEKMKKIKMELEKIKSREMAAMKINSDKKKSVVKKERVKFIMPKRDMKKNPLMNSTKEVDKAFLVNGKVYRPPRLPRPKHWVTDRLYKFLWKHMEPKYKLATRVKSEKFVQELAKVVATIERRKNYENYKTELKALMKEMARLKIINTRMDFYHFCQDFLPFEFRVKAVPMLLPGNKSNIPYDPENVHTPLLDTDNK